MVKKISTRLAELEERIKGPTRLRCKLCGRKGGSQIINETHNLDGSVTFDPTEPCSGCEAISASMGRVTRIVMCRSYTQDVECPVCGAKPIQHYYRLRDAGKPYQAPDMIELVNRSKEVGSL
jgi:hypothetical protein